MGWQWHHLNHMQIICTLLQTDNCQYLTTQFFYGPHALPAPIQQRQSTKGSTTYIDAAYCYRLSSVVCQSVCHTSEPRKNGWTDRDAIWVENLGEPREPCIRWSSRSPHGKGQFWGQKGRPIVKYRDTVVIYAKMAEPIEMPFGLLARMSRRNHELDGTISPHGKGNFEGNGAHCKG